MPLWVSLERLKTEGGRTTVKEDFTVLQSWIPERIQWHKEESGWEPSLFCFDVFQLWTQHDQLLPTPIAVLSSYRTVSPRTVSQTTISSLTKHKLICWLHIALNTDFQEALLALPQSSVFYNSSWNAAKNLQSSTFPVLANSRKCIHVHLFNMCWGSNFRCLYWILWIKSFILSIPYLMVTEKIQWLSHLLWRLKFGSPKPHILVATRSYISFLSVAKH